MPEAAVKHFRIRAGPYPEHKVSRNTVSAGSCLTQRRRHRPSTPLRLRLSPRKAATGDRGATPKGRLFPANRRTHQRKHALGPGARARRATSPTPPPLGKLPGHLTAPSRRRASMPLTRLGTWPVIRHGALRRVLAWETPQSVPATNRRGRQCIPPKRQAVMRRVKHGTTGGSNFLRCLAQVNYSYDRPALLEFTERPWRDRIDILCHDRIFQPSKGKARSQTGS